MQYSIKHTTWYSYTEPVPVCHNIVRLLPRVTESQKCQAFRLVVDPEPPVITRRSDCFGNQLDYFSLHSSVSKLTITAESVVQVMKRAVSDIDSSQAWEDVVRQTKGNRTREGLQIQQFAHPSTRVHFYPELRAFAEKSFPAGRPVVDALRDLMGRIYCEFEFDSRATTVNTPVDEVLRTRSGVCQDFAHLALGCVRMMGLAARYVSGYICTTPPPGQPRLVGADASHAWVAVFCGPLGWIDLDPTNNLITEDAHITIAWGRDYEDICPVQGVFIGGGEHNMGIAVDVIPQQETQSESEHAAGTH